MTARVSIVMISDTNDVEVRDVINVMVGDKTDDELEAGDKNWW